MAVETIPTEAIAGQKPGTSGLRAKTAVFRQPGYLENFVQSVFDVIDAQGKTLVLGGDGRFFNREAIAIILRMSAANGVARVIVGRGGILSTPAVSAVIRARGTDGGLILSASHNPGGPEADFGIKYNISNGGPAPERVTGAIHEATAKISQYRIMSEEAPAIDTIGEVPLAGMAVEVIDPVETYAALMQTLFDFDAIRALFASGFRMRFDAMHAVTGPYARHLLEEALGAPMGSVVRAEPREDFGGLHPDPNPVHAHELMTLMLGPDAPDFGAASDGDGDRNMIVGRGCFVTPSDSLAILAANAHLAPGYSKGLSGIAWSMPTSRAASRVAAALGVEGHETPTGWKFFGSLLDADRVTLCGEESAGTGSTHLREKDGLWAVLLWLNILAERRLSVAEIMTDHWARFGRDYYMRHDYEGLETSVAEALMADLTARLPDLPGQSAGGLTVAEADRFDYTDPVTGDVAMAQGLRIGFAEGARGVLRLSGTGTSGATLRVYLEAFETQRLDCDAAEILSPVAAAMDALAGTSARTGRRRPDMIT